MLQTGSNSLVISLNDNRMCSIDIISDTNTDCGERGSQVTATPVNVEIGAVVLC